MDDYKNQSEGVKVFPVDTNIYTVSWPSYVASTSIDSVNRDVETNNFLSSSDSGEEEDDDGEEENDEEETVEDPDEGFSGDLSLPACPNNGDEFSLSDADIEDLLSDEAMMRDFPDWRPGSL